MTKTNTVRSYGCVSWNIHRGACSRGQFDADRIVDVIAQDIAATKPDILALQEADGEAPPYKGFLDLDRIEAATGLRWIHAAPEARWGPQSHGFLGSLLFVHPEFEIKRLSLVDLPGHYPRGAVVAETRRGGEDLRIIATHLSLAQWLRAVQMRTLGQHIARHDKMRTVLLGDLNEWRPWGGLALSPRFFGSRLRGGAVASFPVRRPVLPLDRILTDAGPAPTDLVTLDSPGIRAASDHRPISARIKATVGEIAEP